MLPFNQLGLRLEWNELSSLSVIASPFRGMATRHVEAVRRSWVYVFFRVSTSVTLQGIQSTWIASSLTFAIAPVKLLAMT